MAAFAQSNPTYILKSFAGTFPTGDGGAAASALLDYPYAAVPDSAGNLYVLDSANYEIRKVTTDGKINRAAILGAYGYDLKLGADGSFYVATDYLIVRIPPSGLPSVVAGTGVEGHTGDGGTATSARIGVVNGLALDSAGNVYFTETSNSYYVREVTTDGKIQTIAGTSSYGFNSDNIPASTALLNYPRGIAVDATGNITIADDNNHRIRRFTVGGNIVTVAGNGSAGQPVNGNATATPLGFPRGLWLDSTGAVYFVDGSYGVVLKLGTDGSLTRVAGNFNSFGSPADGPATAVSLNSPIDVSTDSAGNVYIAETGSHLIRKVTPAGALTTFVGRVHYAGDGGAATAALLNTPTDIALDGRGNTFIADAYNYRIRKVAADGTISTYAGTGTPGTPQSGTPAASNALPFINVMTSDSAGTLYFASATQVWKIGSDGVIRLVAGTGASGNTGDGGAAESATFQSLTGIAVDASGNVYVADNGADRVRLISAATDLVTAYAGTGSRGSTGDGGLATSGLLAFYTNINSPLALDSHGNLYIGDNGNNKIRMVSPQGILTTFAGTGTLGNPDGVPVTSAFADANAMVCDAAGNLYVAGYSFDAIYRISGGTVQRISGTSGISLADGTPALSAAFTAYGLKIDANGDLYAADPAYNVVRKLVLNSPTALTIADGNNQTAQTGQALPKALKVQLNGRAGVGVAGATVTFAVTAGSATLSAASTATDLTGLAGIAVTLGSAPGSVTITATAAGLSPVVFTETATAPPPTCALPAPVITSVNSAGDFGGLASFTSGSWLEIKGSNLAPDTRQWTGNDFKGSLAPTSLDGVSVTVNGNNAAVDYISPQQINIQAPAGSGSGPVKVVVTTSSCSSGSATAQAAALAPGVLAPSSFNIGGTQYLVATLPDGSYVGKPNLIQGVAFRPAAPGDTVTAYGIGFGDVTPAVAPGTIAGAANSIPNLTISFGSIPAGIAYAGLAQGYVGLYWFTFTVPSVPDGDYAITFQVGSTKAQTTYLTVQK
jgi:uncharacterized protein (TIGR03437 family)